MCIRSKVPVKIFLKKLVFSGFPESIDEFAILVNVQLWPPVDIQFLTFVLYGG